jgi:hypothetical protein
MLVTSLHLVTDSKFTFTVNSKVASRNYIILTVFDFRLTEREYVA